MKQLSEQLNLWSTPLFKLNTEAWLDPEELLTELISNVPFGPSALLEVNHIESGLMPLTLSAMGVQHARIQECLESFCHRQIKSMDTASWLFYSRTGNGLEPHYHSGQHALFTSVLYLTDSLSELVLRDPRGNACRGYDDVMREHFNSFRIKPKAGDLYLFPCYVEHFVATGPDQPRLSILTNYSFEMVKP